MILERQGVKPVTNPSEKRLAAELRRLKSYGKSSFASLTDADGNYLQVAGGGVGCMLEWRNSKAKTHMRAFLQTPSVPFEDGAELVFGGGRIPLRRDEWLNIRQVIETFVAFAAGNPLPSAISWRDMSEVVGLR